MKSIDLIGALELARGRMRGLEALGEEYYAAQEVLSMHLGQVRLLSEILGNQLGEEDACLGLDVIEALVMAAPVGFVGSLVADKKRAATGGVVPQGAGVGGAVEGDGEGAESGERGGVHAGSVSEATAEGKQSLWRRLWQRPERPQQPNGLCDGSSGRFVQQAKQFVFGRECSPLLFATVQEWEGFQSRRARVSLVMEMAWGEDDARVEAACKECAAVFARVLEGGAA